MRAPLSILLALLACSCDGAGDQVVTIGAILPMTGDLADTGPEIEQGLLLAAERINAAGGLAGRPVRIRIQDTGSDPQRGIAGATELLAQHPELFALVGPEEDDVARGLLPLLKAQRIACISGGVVSTALSQIDDGDFFFRTNPAALQLAQTLSSRMKIDGVTRAGVIFTDTEYGRSLSGEFSNAYAALEGTIVAPGAGYQGPYAVAAGQPSYREEVLSLQAQAPEGLVLITDPKTGAQLVRDWALIGGTGRLYLAPSLRTEAFAQSIPAGFGNGMVGASASLGREARAFADEYQRRFGSAPRPEAYFYYDALALIALATEAAAHDAGGKLPAREVLPRYLKAVSAPEGTQVRWSELGKALELARAGQELDYQGASGDVDFTEAGEVIGNTEIWTVQGNTIVTAD